MNTTIIEEIRPEQQEHVRVAPYVLDADAHVNPAPGMWAEYLSPQFRELAPTLESDGEFDYVVFEGSRKKVIMIGANAGRSVDKFKSYGKLSDMRLGGWMAPHRLADMDRDGIDAAVVYGGGPLATGNFDLYIDSYRAYNRWVADFCSHDPKRLTHVAYIPMIDVDLAIEMMREARKAGAVGVNIPAFPQSKSIFNKAEAQAQALTGDASGERMYRDPEFDPFWAAACELDLAIAFHLGARAPRFFAPINVLPDMPMNRISMLEVAGIMLFGGVFDRFPALRVGLIESGIGWLGWATHFHDRSWRMQQHWTGCTINHTPTYYWERNLFASFVSDPAGVQMRDRPGCRNIMWSSDYPHSETSFPNSHETLAEHIEGLSAVDRDWIVADCAKLFYGLG